MKPFALVRLVALIVVVAGLTFVITASVRDRPRQADNPSEKTTADEVDVDLDEASAIQIAEIILVRVYGKDVLEERPWNVTNNGDVFRIEGTLMEGTLGGVAEIEINRTNAEVVSIIHGK
jgi:hypothetical protein